MIDISAIKFGRRKYTVILVAAGLYFFSQVAFAVLIEPGVGVGLEYTDNATMVEEDKVDDLITVGYVGARLSEDEGALTYDAAASFNNHSYTQDTFADKRYFNLGARADWAMVKDRFNWFLRNTFGQRTINTLNSNTPNNIQDTNVFTFGANVRFPLSARQYFSLVPMFKQFYYETQATNNKQYSVAANWNYQMFRLSSVGLSFSTRNVDYFEQAIANTRFTNLGFVLSGSRKKSSYAVNLGSTNVKRENGQETTGFSGYLNWRADISSRSEFTTNFSTGLTDASSASAASAGNPGNGNDVQVTTDVIRNSVANLAYIREDATFNSRIWMRYNKLTYSDNPLDRVIRAFGLQINHPVTQLLSSGAYVNYNRTKQLDDNRLDKRFTVGGNLRYNLSRKLHGLLDLKYRKKESTVVSQNFDEYSAFVSLVYGFGDVRRPTRTGGF